MDKDRLSYIFRRSKKFNTLILLLIAVTFAVIGTFGLRHNNQRMISLRNAVFDADKQGKGIEESLKDLREFVYAHMNTNLSSGANAVKPPIQLKYQYERLTAAAQAEFDAANAKVLSDASNTCVAQFPGNPLNPDRLACVKSYAENHPVKLREIPEDLYKFDFASPSWSPDTAGWSLVFAGLFGAIAAVKVMFEGFWRAELDK